MLKPFVYVLTSGDYQFGHFKDYHTAMRFLKNKGWKKIEDITDEDKKKYGLTKIRLREYAIHGITHYLAVNRGIISVGILVTIDLKSSKKLWSKKNNPFV